MSVAKKVSIRMDSQGVLSLQFMVEVEGGGAGTDAPSEKLSFVDFVVVPMIEDEGDDEDGGEEGADETLLEMDGDGDGMSE